jgi:condensin complex subunit 1
MPAEKLAKGTDADARASKDKEGEELDQVVGNAEDEIGDRVAAIRETELLYGPESLLAVYGPIIVRICGSPHVFKVRCRRAARGLTDRRHRTGHCGRHRR